jgi:hypothetical protein
LRDTANLVPEFQWTGKCVFQPVLKGHGFSRAVQVLHFCHSERALAREETAFAMLKQIGAVITPRRS